jgi:hypothetical protein
MREFVAPPFGTGDVAIIDSAEKPGFVISGDANVADRSRMVMERVDPVLVTRQGHELHGLPSDEVVKDG